MASPAQSTKPEAVPYEAQLWTNRDGLPQNWVTAIQQTQDGKLWVSTFGGLACFDGLRFETFDWRALPALRSNRMISMCKARDGDLWVGIESSGLVRIRGAAVMALEHGDGLLGNRVQRLFEDAAGRLWIGTNAGLCCIVDGQIVSIEAVQTEVVDLAEFPAGTLWIVSPGKLLRWRAGELTTLSEDGPFRSVLVASDDSVWVGTSGQRVMRWRDARAEVLELPVDGVGAMVEDRNGAIWFGATPRPVRWHEGQFSDPFEAHGYPLRSRSPADAALVDREGNVWFGGKGGLVRLRPAHLTGVSVPARFQDPPRAVAADREGSLWLALQDGDLLRLANGVFTDMTETAGVEADSIALARDGSLWTASARGLWRIQDGGAVVERVDLGLPGGRRRALLEDSSARLWVACGSRLYRRGANQDVDWSVSDGLPGGEVLALLESSRADFWVGTSEGLCYIVGDEVKRTWKRRRELPAGAVRGLWEGREGRIWVGTYGGGVCRVSRVGSVSRFVGLEQGLCEAVVSRIVDAGNGKLVLQGNRAISLVSLSELNAAADDPLSRVYPRVFYSGPGVNVFEGMGGASPPECRTPDGLWFPAQEGLVCFDPSRRPAERPPVALIEEVIVNGSVHHGGGVVTVPPGKRELEIRFSAPTFVDAETTRFRYRLAGYDEDWIDSGVRRTIAYSQVPPGHYRFHVLATNTEGVWSETGGSISIDLQPWLYETAWFRGILILVIGTMLGVGFLWWVGRVRTRSQELEKLVSSRTRQLQGEIGERKFAENAMRDARDHLEEKVEARTAELAEALKMVQLDAAKREALEGQLRESQKFEAVGRLAGGLAHDFNNILTAILVESDMVLESLQGAGPDLDHQREGLIAIKDAGKRSARLTRQLLAYSRQQVLQPEVVAPNTAIRDLEKMLRRLVAADIELRLDLAPQVGYVHVDPGQLGQVIVNLIVNASEAIDGVGRITIQTSATSFGGSNGVGVSGSADVRSGPYVLIAVRDTGSGIDAEAIDHIFEPFFTTKGPAHGTGLGLASVDGIIRQSGGLIRVASEPGMGTTFRVYLPEVESAQPVEPVAEPVADVAPAEGTILLCDDEPTVRRVASRLLRNKGYQVITAETPERAVELWESRDGEIDLLITDLVMPGMAGTEVAARLRVQQGDLRVLYISGYSPDRLLDQEELDANTQFLHKPFNSEMLLRRVATILVAP